MSPVFVDKKDKTVVLVISESKASTGIRRRVAAGNEDIIFYPYKDLEKGMSDALASLFKYVIVVRSEVEASRIDKRTVNLVFYPDVSTEAYNNSSFTWPPTDFIVQIDTSVTNQTGVGIANFSVRGTGGRGAGTSGLLQAGQNASLEALDKFRRAVMENEKLYK
jgi:hypothetical protein